MLTEFKFTIAMELCVWKKHIEDKAKQRWYYGRIPKRIAKAFTLAEVLITLTIVGIIASLTIPSLTNNINNQQLKVKWKKSFSTFSQAAILLNAEGNGWPDTNSALDVLCSKINCLKRCYQGSSYGNCWHNAYEWKDESGNPTAWPNNDGGLVLNSGEIISAYGFAVNQIDVFVDVNGKTGPNQFNKDILNLTIFTTNGRTNPARCNENRFTNSCDYLSN